MVHQKITFMLFLGLFAVLGCHRPEPVKQSDDATTWLLVALRDQSEVLVMKFGSDSISWNYSRNHKAVSGLIDNVPENSLSDLEQHIQSASDNFSPSPRKRYMLIRLIDTKAEAIQLTEEVFRSLSTSLFGSKSLFDKESIILLTTSGFYVKDSMLYSMIDGTGREVEMRAESGRVQEMTRNSENPR